MRRIGQLGRLRWRRAFGVALVVAGVASLGNHSAAAPQTLQVSFVGGDVSADPQSLNGTNTDRKVSAKGSHTATIAFDSFNNGTCTNNVGVLSYLQERNPIAATMEIWIDKMNPLNSGNKLAWNTEIDGTSYRILLFQFPQLLTSESASGTNIQGSNGNVEIIVTQKGKRLLAQGTKCTSVVDVNLTVSK